MRNVLILTRSPDPHMPPVAEAIRARGSGVVCFNLADFPEEVALQATLDGRQDGWPGSISYQEQHVPLDSLASIWWRRPKQYKAPAAYSPGERTFLEEEANRGIIGVLESLALQQTLWVSRLHSIRRAELKPLQLAAAQEVGLRTPRTLLTNDPGAARTFYEACQGQVVLKAVSRGAIEEEERRFIYTSRVLPEHLACQCDPDVISMLIQQNVVESQFPFREMFYNVRNVASGAACKAKTYVVKTLRRGRKGRMKTLRPLRCCHRKTYVEITDGSH